MNTLRPLWELARFPLNQLQNQSQFHVFLQENQRNHHYSHQINQKILFLRISILAMLYQIELVSFSKYLAAYLIIKILVLFRFQCQNIKILDVVIVSVFFPFLSFAVSNLPFSNAIFWGVPLFYFLFGFQQKYLSLQLLTNGHSLISNLSILMIILLGNIKKRPIYSHYIIITDTIAFLLLNMFTQAIISAGAFCFVKIICYSDRRMKTTKKVYKHLYEVPKIEEYH